MAVRYDAPAASPSGAEFDGANPVAVDSVTAAVLATLPDTTVNGFVVKVAGSEVGYGRGQGFMLLEEGAGTATDQGRTGSVLFRVSPNGAIGTNGGIHIAPGLRKPSGGAQAAWIDLYENIAGLMIHNPAVADAATWDQPYLRVVDRRNADAVIFSVDSDTHTRAGGTVIAESGETNQVYIGDVFGSPGIAMGLVSPVLIYKAATNVAGIINAVEMGEMTEPAAPAVNKGRLFLKDNGAGKTQLCCKFNTGAAIILATQV